MRTLAELGLIKLGGPRECCGATQAEHVGKTCEEVRDARRAAIRARLSKATCLHCGERWSLNHQCPPNLADNIDING